MVKITVKLKKKPQAAVVVITAMGEEVRIGEGGRIKQGHDVFLNPTSQPAINRNRHILGKHFRITSLINGKKKNVSLFSFKNKMSPKPSIK